MMNAVTATYDGTNFILDEKWPIRAGQKVIIKFSDDKRRAVRQAESERMIFERLGEFAGRGKKMFASTEEIDSYIRELRDNDRI